MAGLAATVPEPDRYTPGHVGLVPTRRPPSAGAAPGDAGPTAGAEPPPLVELPRELSGYRLECWLAVEGAGEVERVAVVSARRKRRIVKFYRVGFGPGPGVHDAWLRIEHPRVVALHRAGTAGDRGYEIMTDVGDRLGGADAPPDARRTTLRDLLLEHPRGLPEAQVVDLVRQLAEAVAELGRARLAHLDVRPENVLVTRQDGADGPRRELTLIDFGHAARLAEGTTWDVSRPITGYTAPELLASSVTDATDWWSLGIMAAELAVGGHPLLHLQPRTIGRQLATNNIPHPDGLPERIRALYEGLTALDGRWGAAEVAAWAAGRAPAVPPRRSAPDARVFEFGGEEFRHLPALMAALQDGWAEAAAALFGPAADRWAELAAWLPQFDRAGFSAREIVRRLQRTAAEPDPWPADARLLVLLARAAPSLEPRYYRGIRVDRQAIAGLARIAVDGDAAAGADDVEPPDLHATGTIGNAHYREVIQDLWCWRLLPELESVAGGRTLTAVDDLWRRLDQRWQVLLEVLAGSTNPVLVHLADQTAETTRAHLLWVAADGDARGILRRGVERTREFVEAQLGGPDPMFEELAAAALPGSARGWRRLRPDATEPAERDLDELVGLLALHLVRDAITIQAMDLRERRDSAAQEQAARAVAWRRRERWWVLDLPVALGWAAAAMGILLVSLAGLLIVGDALPPQAWLPPATDDALARAWAFTAWGLAAQTACELWLAASIGAPYHRDYSLSTELLHLAGAAANRFGRTYLAAAAFLVLAMAGLIAILAVLLVAPYALLIPAVAVHIESARRRHHRWVAERTRLREQFDTPPVAAGVASSEGQQP